jgi:hypothetical protein
MRESRSHRAGDVAAVAIHLPEREDALRDLARQGWTSVPEESAVEEETGEGEVAEEGNSG